MGGPAFATGILLVVVVFSLVVSWYARRFTRTTLEFYLAGRTIGLFTSASAVCGDYFSAASFLGVAGVVYAWGLDGMWFGTGYAAGFVPLLLFFAAPLRRFGAYTLPDLLEARFGSHLARLLGTSVVLLGTVLYLVPQMMGVGIVWRLVAGRGLWGLDAYTTGVLVTAAVMVVYSATGGMRGTTWNQAIQFWILFAAVLSVVILAVAAGFGYSQAMRDLHGQVLLAAEPWKVRDLLRTDPSTGTAAAELARAVMSPAYWSQRIEPHLQRPDDVVIVLMPRPSRIREGASVLFSRPGALYGPVDQVSLVLTLVLGTSGLPHVVMRYFTHPTGRTARWSTVGVLALAFAFYSLAAAAGVAGRALIPELVAGEGGGPPEFAVAEGVLVAADMVLPFLAQTLGGPVHLGFVAAGAIAAILSTVGGLLMVGAASLGHDLFEQFIRPDAPEPVKVRAGRLSVMVMAAVAAGVGLLGRQVATHPPYPALIAVLVTWAFSLLASGMVPGLLLAIWWKGTTLRGFMGGVGMGTLVAVMILARNLAELTGHPLLLPLLAWRLPLTLPTVVAAPLALATGLVISWLDRGQRPANLDSIWMRMHGTAAERQLTLVAARRAPGGLR